MNSTKGKLDREFVEGFFPVIYSAKAYIEDFARCNFDLP